MDLFILETKRKDRLYALIYEKIGLEMVLGMGIEKSDSKVIEQGVGLTDLRI